MHLPCTLQHLPNIFWPAIFYQVFICKKKQTIHSKQMEFPLGLWGDAFLICTQYILPVGAHFPFKPYSIPVSPVSPCSPPCNCLPVPLIRALVHDVRRSGPSKRTIWGFCFFISDMKVVRARENQFLTVLNPTTGY